MNNRFLQASSSGDAETVKSLLGQGADPNARHDGATALTLAAAKGHLAVTKALLRNGANPRVADAMNRSPLLHAVSEVKMDVAKLIAQHLPAAAAPSGSQSGLTTFKGPIDADATQNLRYKKMFRGCMPEAYSISTSATLFKYGRTYEYIANNKNGFDVFKHTHDGYTTNSYENDGQNHVDSSTHFKITKIGTLPQSHMHRMIDREIERLCKSDLCGDAYDVVRVTFPFRSADTGPEQSIDTTRTHAGAYAQAGRSYVVAAEGSGLSTIQRQAIARANVKQQNDIGRIIRSANP